MGTLAVVSSYELNSISKARTFRSIIAAGTSSVDSSRFCLVDSGLALSASVRVEREDYISILRFVKYNSEHSPTLTTIRQKILGIFRDVKTLISALTKTEATCMTHYIVKK